MKGLAGCGLERQIRIEGTATRVTTYMSDAYFKNRPGGSQVGALAFPQSYHHKR